MFLAAYIEDFQVEMQNTLIGPHRVIQVEC